MICERFVHNIFGVYQQMSFKAAPFPINEKRRAETVAKIDLIDKHEDTLFYSYCELGKVISGFEFAAVTVMTADMQCSLSSSDGTRVEGEREASICQYAILDPEPTIVYELQDHPIFSKQRMVVSGELKGSFCAFPIINKNNYALGTFCLVNDEPKEISPATVASLKTLVDRLAFQLDTYIDQSEVTAETLFNCVKKFTEAGADLNISDLSTFLAVICDRPIKAVQKKALVNAGLISNDVEAKPYQLTAEGIKLKKKMGLSTVPMKRQKVVGAEATDLLDQMFENLGEL